MAQLPVVNSNEPVEIDDQDLGWASPYTWRRDEAGHVVRDAVNQAGEPVVIYLESEAACRRGDLPPDALHRPPPGSEGFTARVLVTVGKFPTEMAAQVAHDVAAAHFGEEERFFSPEEMEKLLLPFADEVLEGLLAKLGQRLNVSFEWKDRPA